MQLIRAATAPEVWLKGVDHLMTCEAQEDFDVFLHVETPTILSSADHAVLKALDAFLSFHGGYSVNTVAETIFPLADYLRHGAKGVYDLYPARMKSIRAARSDRGWGCYVLRFVEQKGDDGKIFNPLKQLVEKIQKHGRYRASHELNIGPIEEDLQIYNAGPDRKRLYGGPCLSHVSLKVYDGIVRMNATYRSHFYVQRLMGNLIGLGRLLFFIAKESGLQVGPLTINSTFARLDTGSDNRKECHWGKTDITAIVCKCHAIYDQASVKSTVSAPLEATVRTPARSVV